MSLKAQLLVESFDYPAGDSLTAHGWVANSGGILNRILVTAPGLDYSGYQLPGIGNATTLLANGQDVYKPFTAQSSGSVYSFFIIKVDTARGSAGIGDYFFGYIASTSTTNFTCRVYIRNSITLNNKFAFGITKNAISGGAVIWSDSTYTIGTKYLVCAKYTFNSGTTNDDQVSLFLFDGAVPPFEPTPTLGPVTSTSTDVADVARLFLRQAANTPSYVIDEIYTGTNWSTLLPVELSSFTSSVIKREVTLNWTTASERNNSGFDIERSNQTANEWTKVGNVSGNGTTNSSVNYLFTDRGLASGSYNYRLKQIDFNGNFEYFNLNNEVNIGIPSNYDLSQNYPNPFNPSTKINYDLPYDGNVSIKLFDMSGKEVETLVNESKTAGYYSVNFNAAGLSSGVYFYSISADNFSATKKMLLLK